MATTAAIDKPVRLLIISDDGRDPDDELAKVVTAGLKTDGLVEPLGYIGCLHPNKTRARLSKGTLKALGMGSIDVAIGAGMPDNLSDHEFDYAPYLNSTSIKELQPDGAEMFAAKLERAPSPVTIIVLAGMRDLALLLERHHALVKAKVAQVVIQAGAQLANGKINISVDGEVYPDDAYNNQCDAQAARDVYSQLQAEGVPLLLVSKTVAYAAQLPYWAYDRMNMTGHPVGFRLQHRANDSIQQLWEFVNSPQAPPGRRRAWFIDTFIRSAKDKVQAWHRKASDSIWDLLSGFNPYDIYGELGAIPAIRKCFFNITTHTNGVLMKAHVIGTTPDQPGILDIDALRNYTFCKAMNGLGQHSDSVFQCILAKKVLRQRCPRLVADGAA